MEKDLKKKNQKVKPDGDADKQKRGKKPKAASSSARDNEKNKEGTQKNPEDDETVGLDDPKEQGDKEDDKPFIPDDEEQDDEDSPKPRKPRKQTKKKQDGESAQDEESGEKGIVLQYLRSVASCHRDEQAIQPDQRLRQPARQDQEESARNDPGRPGRGRQDHRQGLQQVKNILLQPGAPAAARPRRHEQGQKRPGLPPQSEHGPAEQNQRTQGRNPEAGSHSNLG